MRSQGVCHHFMKSNTDTVKQRTSKIILKLFIGNNAMLLMNYREKLTPVKLAEIAQF